MNFSDGIHQEKQSYEIMTNSTPATFHIFINSSAGDANNSWVTGEIKTFFSENSPVPREVMKSNHTHDDFANNSSDLKIYSEISATTKELTFWDTTESSISESLENMQKNLTSQATSTITSDTTVQTTSTISKYSHLSYDLFENYFINNFSLDDFKWPASNTSSTMCSNCSILPAISDNWTSIEDDTFLNNCSHVSWTGFYSHCVVVTPLEIVIAIVLSVFIVATIVGNVFVILSVALFRKMRTMSNLLIVSLASADLLVAIVVLPISLQSEIVGQWTLGPQVCDLWITADVFCCTASILNIVVIALDRYWLITKNVKYTHRIVCPRRKVCAVMLFLAWTVAALISCSPLIGWRKGTEKDDPRECLISQEYGYTIFSTFGAFWLPLLVILLVYFKIFRFARKRVTRRHRPMNGAVPLEASCAFTRVPNEALLAVPRAHHNPIAEATSMGDLSLTPPESLQPVSPVPTPACQVYSSPPCTTVQLRDARYRKNRTKRIRRSARTLGLIIGCFLLCWMPFFLVATVKPFCEDCMMPPIVSSLVLWLGYSNSLLNPAIYAIWDISFRKSFVKLATCDIR